MTPKSSKVVVHFFLLMYFLKKSQKIISTCYCQEPGALPLIKNTGYGSERLLPGVFSIIFFPFLCFYFKYYN
jgi:hypothetical protein